MTITKLWEVINEEIDRVDANGQHKVMLSIESKLFDKVIDKILSNLGIEDKTYKEKMKLTTDTIQYLSYTLVRQKKELKNHE